MSKYKYPGFDKIDNDSPLLLSLTLCDILHSFFGERDFSYISAALYPLELTELILHYLEYDKKVDKKLIDDFSKKYLTEDSLCPVHKLLGLWGKDKFDQMTVELQNLADK